MRRRRTAATDTSPCCGNGSAKTEKIAHRRGGLALSASDGVCPAITCVELRDEETTRKVSRSSLLRRRPRRRDAVAGKERGAAGEALARAIQHRRGDRDQHHRALHRQRPDHDRARQGLCARMVQGGRRRAACSTSACRTDFEGTATSTSASIRALDSKEVFMPARSATASCRSRRTSKSAGSRLTLRTATKIAKPGEPFRIGYKTDRPARIAVFAVDQGILQVSDYKLPDPLSHSSSASAR